MLFSLNNLYHDFVSIFLIYKSFWAKNVATVANIMLNQKDTI